MKKARLIPVLVTTLVVGLAALLAVWLILHGRESAPVGAIVFDENVPSGVKEFVNDVAETLAEDILVKMKAEARKTEDERLVLYNIYVPVEDFNATRLSIGEEELFALWEANGGSEEGEADGGIRLIPISEISSRQRLLMVGEEYYLDTFNSGAVFEYLELSGGNEDEVKELSRKLTEKRPKVGFETGEVLTLAQTGVTALSRGMYTKLRQVGNDGNYFAENLKDFFKNRDLVHTSNEASFSNMANSNNICAAPEMVGALTAINLNIVELTGNHNIDCGDNDAIATIGKYQELGMKTFGGGVSAEAAAVPLEISEKGTKITMLGYNLSTGGYTLDGTPGANFYTEEKGASDIAAAKERGDFVIVDIQYYECNEYVFTTENTTCDRANSSAGDQIGFFRHLIDLGADVVVGTSAHQPQTFEEYGKGAIYYGLGNLFFDQAWWPGTTRSIILVHYFENGKLLQTRLVPTVYDFSYQTRIMGNTAAEEFLARLAQVRPNA